MATPGPRWREPWSLASWALLLVAAPIVFFGPVVLGSIVLLASAVAGVVAVRRANRDPAGQRRAGELPPR